MNNDTVPSDDFNQVEHERLSELRSGIPFRVLRVPKILLALPILFILAGFIAYGLLFQQYSPIKNLTIADISDHKVSLSWTTLQKSTSTVVISTSNNFPFAFTLWSVLVHNFPPQMQNVFKGDGVGVTEKTFSMSHRLELTQLEPNRSYYYKVYQGLREVYQGSFTTGPTLLVPTTPNVVYGQIWQADSKTPAHEVLVYLLLENESTKSAAVSTLTNGQGRWLIDLANARTPDLKNPFLVNKKTKEKVTVVTSQGSFGATSNLDADKPWPDIILRAK